MKWRQQFLVRCIAAIVIGGAVTAGDTALALTVESSEGMEVLTRGPVHEAFAETVAFDPEAGIIIPRQPPPLIEEALPDQRPTGDNVAWIPGYWAWEEDQNDFLWISGIWRNLPPGREWVPGYWSVVDNGNQWTSGYWQDAEATQVTYLPEPPRSVEAGPNIAAASDDQTWIPGNWQYEQDRYAWRAGYWVNAREDWSWTPSYYRWTRRGYVYVDGYWDYPVVRRGVVFAPVRFQRSYIERPDFHYSPLTVIAISVFSNHLFVRPDYGHYYFGDYYEPRYRGHYHASYSYDNRHRGYDPIFAHYRWENRRNRNWVQERRNDFEQRRDHADSRPPRTWAALSSRPSRDGGRGDFNLAERYDRMTGNSGNKGNRFQNVSEKERERFVSQRTEIRNFGRERERQEISVARPKPDRDGRTEASRVTVGRSPVAGKRADRFEKGSAPPARLQSRASDREKIAGNDGRSERAPKDGKAVSAGPKEDDRRAGTRVPPSRESRTQPGQRREATTAPQTTRKQPETYDKGAQERNRTLPPRESRTLPGQRREPAKTTGETPAKGVKSDGNPVGRDRREVGRETRNQPNPRQEVPAAPKTRQAPAPAPSPAPRSGGRQEVLRKPTATQAAREKIALPQPRQPDARPARDSGRQESKPQPNKESAPRRREVPAPVRQAPQRAQPRQQDPVPPQRSSQRRPQSEAPPQRAPQQQKVRNAPQREQARTPQPPQTAQPQRPSPRQQPAGNERKHQDKRERKN